MVHNAVVTQNETSLFPLSILIRLCLHYILFVSIIIILLSQVKSISQRIEHYFWDYVAPN